MAAAKEHGVELTAIWNTHHHWDHTGGNKDLLTTHPELEVIAHASDKGRIPGQTTFAEESDVVTLGDEVSAEIIHNPGHTTGAISFYVRAHGALFTGDTLFAGGCGRLFEGTAAMMSDPIRCISSFKSPTAEAVPSARSELLQTSSANRGE